VEEYVEFLMSVSDELLEIWVCWGSKTRFTRVMSEYVHRSVHKEKYLVIFLLN
jgi:hypothetical protein